MEYNSNSLKRFNELYSKWNDINVGATDKELEEMLDLLELLEMSIVGVLALRRSNYE